MTFWIPSVLQEPRLWNPSVTGRGPERLSPDSVKIARNFQEIRDKAPLRPVDKPVYQSVDIRWISVPRSAGLRLCTTATERARFQEFSGHAAAIAALTQRKFGQNGPDAVPHRLQPV